MLKKIKTIQDFQKLLLKIVSILLLLFLIVFISKNIKAQSVVVNGYFNASSSAQEWTELVVINDNVDMRDWTIRDNNSSQTSWQPAVTFRNIPFWNNMRAGTIIIIWHRNGSIEDTNKEDGYIQISAQNTSYFSGGTFSPDYSLNIAGSGDIIQIRNASGMHIHALGHKSTPDSCWNNLPTPKLNHASSASNDDAIYVCPGGNISDYNGPSGTSLTSRNNTTITLGLPNTCSSAPNDNTNYIRSLREPIFTSQTVNAITSATYPTVALTFTWNAATDPIHSDQTQGYMIVRSNTGVFGTPQDGVTYNIGDAIPGGGTVIAHIDNTSASTYTYTDYDANTSGTFCYRVYAYRYNTDDLNGNNYHIARGRAYNTTNFVTVNCVTNPLPITLSEFSVKKDKEKSLIQWTTISEINNDYFIVERSNDAENFYEISKVKGAGNSNTILNYQVKDYSPLSGTNYYRLKQVDFDGSYTYSDIKALNFEKNLSPTVYYYDNKLHINATDVIHNLQIEIYDVCGKLIYQNNQYCNSNTITVNINQNLENGMYIAVIRTEEQQNSYKFVISK
jgi:hypothetical protein